MRLITPWALTLIASTALAQDASEQDFEDAAPLDLGAYEITGGRLELSVEQEATLRLVRLGLDRSRSSREEDKDEWVCWFEDSTGTRFNHLACARNGDIWAQSDEARGAFGAMRGDTGASLAAGDPGYGSILRTTRPVNRYKLERMLAQLPGSRRVDEEFVLGTASGRTLPRDLPGDEELQAFAAAYRAVEALHGGDQAPAYDAAMESRMSAAIETAGLSVERYNRLVELIEIYASLRADLGALLSEG